MMARRSWGMILALAVAGCSADAGPLGVEQVGSGTPEVVQAMLSCRVAIADGGMTCSVPEPSLAAGSSAALLGGQGVNVLLESDAVAYDQDNQVFSARVRVRNFLTQQLGTVDGINADPDGVRVFFVNDPQTLGGTGVVTVANAHGSDQFTTAGQPYFQYDGILDPGQRSAAVGWEWDVPGTVESFSFQVGVSARVADEGNIAPGPQLDLKSVATGEEHSCGLTAAGEAYCWGKGETGQLGNGSTADRLTPTAVAGDHRFAAISAGGFHTCAITEAGAAYCWGTGANGRLGNGAVTDQVEPVPVFGGLNFKAISVGGEHTCGLTVDGDAYCWGRGANGKLGHGSTSESTLPALVLGGLKFNSISAGNAHACAVATSGAGYCWGAASNGKRGDGLTSGNALQPVQVLNVSNFVSIVAGVQYSCGLTTDGAAYCWGSNGSGQLGIDSTDPSDVPVLVHGGHKFKTINIWHFHTCALTDEGAAYCWGSSGRGKLGDGGSGYAYTPARVLSEESFVSIDVAADHTCGVTSTGKGYCWGNGGSGRLGSGSTDNTSIPVLVSTASSAVTSPQP